MKIRFTAVAALYGLLYTGISIAPVRAKAQAAPGPLPSPQSNGIPIPPPPARPKRKEPAPRTTIGGAWKLNHDESDDPRRKIKDTKSTTAGNPRGYPGGGPSVGFPFPGAGGPMGGPGGRGVPRGDGNEKDDPTLLQAVQPAQSLGIDLKTGEVDVTEDESHKLIFYTDGRQLQKPKDDSYQEIAAHWDGTRLVSDEKSPEKGKLSRTFELSQDGRQFYETVHVDTNKSKTPVVIQYVYDMASPETELSHATDPNQPVMKRHSEDASTTSQNPGAQPSLPADPDQPTMKRRSDDGSDSATQTPQTQTPQAQPPVAPDPDQPVMKRRTDSSSAPSQ